MSSVLEILHIEELKIMKNNLLYQIQRIDNELEKRTQVLFSNSEEEITPKPKIMKIKIKKKNNRLKIIYFIF